MKLTLLAVVANAAIVLSATVAPTEHPTEHPTVIPTVEPSVKPTAAPSIAPTLLPTVEPSVKPTAAPSIAPTLLPTVEPSVKPTAAPSIAPTLLPTVEPSVKPTVLPTVEPSVKPTVQPTIAPTLLPTVEPSVKPTVLPTMAPTVMPTVLPTVMPTVVPTVMPTVTPTVMPTVAPSLMPTVMPTVMPTIAPSLMPTIHPTVQPSETPTQPPSHHPTISGPGWLIQSYYTNDSSTDPVVVYGTRTQECLAANQNLLPDTYYKYSCGDGYIQFQIYNDSSCTHQDHQSEISLDFEWNLEGIAFNQHYGPEYIRYWYLDLQTIRFQCVDDADLYSFAADQKYAVTEFYPTDGTENDESEQCDTDYTQFAAYQKGYCFGIYKYQDEDYHYYNFYDNDYERFAYYKFSASDDTFISLTSFSSDDCSYESDEYFIHNIFPVDECEANFYDGYFDAAHKKAEKRVIKNHAANPLRFDSSTPTAMQMVMSESLAKAQNKPYVSLEQRAKNHNDQVRAHLEQKHPEKLEAMRKAAETRKAAAETRKAAAETRKAAPAPAVATTAAAGSKKTKDIPAWDYPWTDDYYVPKAESGNAYFTDDHYGNDYASAYYYMDDDFFIPGASKDQYLSEYYVWKNVPALTTAPAPQQWFTEVVYAWDEEEDDDKVALVSTRQTQQCMAFMEDGYVEFNYKIICQGEYVIVMYYEWDDVTCAGDYYTQTKYYEYLTDNYGDDFGKREYDMDDYMYECSNVMFSSEWANATADNTYATEFFYPLAGYNETNDDYTAVECPIASEETESVTMAVAILQDWCFTIYSNWDDNYFSAKYWVDQEDNNQNIQFTVWEAPDCNNKFVTQTKEVEINHCYDEQPNSVYQYYYYWWDAKSKDSLAKETKQDVTFANKALMQFTKHDTMKTRFNQLLVKGMPKKMKARRQAAIQKMKNAVQTKQADKKTESAYDDYYYYYDQGNAFFNNRQSHSKNQWFSIPTSATIPPSETPSLAPSEMPSIAPTMAPVPPTLRPTPSAGSPTASPTHQVTYTFEAEQILEGITAEEFNSNENNTIVFQEAVAMAIPPLTADNIEVSSVIDTVAARRLRGLTSNSVNITYWVTYRVAETGYNDAETAYDALVNGLTTAIEETDLFDGYITVLVEKYVSDMEGTTSNSVWESEATQIGTDDDSKPNTRNHHKVLVGVLVGLGGGLLLIALIAYCIFGRGEQAQAQSYSNPQSVEMTGVDPTTHKSAI